MTDPAENDPAPPPTVTLPLRHVTAVVVGNALEFYDFLTYGYFALYIGRTFFPSGDATTSLLASLATFGAGFLTRPIGAIVIGSMGDRLGRKPAMMLSFGIMGVAIVGLSLTPSYGQIGYAAPILVVFFRMLQGFALGGEVGPSTAYLVEAAPAHRRGLYASMQNASQQMAVLAAGIVGTVLAATLDAQQLQDWGWRVAMLLGACIVPFGLTIRRNLPETLHAAEDAALAPDTASAPPRGLAGLRPYRRIIILGLLMLTAGTIGTYVVNFMTTYALTILSLPPTAAFGILIVNGTLSVIFQPLSGWLSDRYGRKRVMLIPGVILLLSIIPAFWLITQYRSIGVFYAAIAWLVPIYALSSTPVVVTLTESLPRRIRSGMVATVYAFAISIFGGSTQFAVAWLLDVTKDPLTPAYYWTAAAILGLSAMAFVRESAPIKRAHHVP